MQWYPASGLQVPVRYRSLKRVVEPEREPVSLLEAKQHLRVDITEDDSYIERIITVAREYAETYCDMTFIMTKWQMRFDRFPYTIRLPKPPAYIGILRDTGGDVKIEYATNCEAATYQELDPSMYRYDYDINPGCIYFHCQNGWPSDQWATQNGVQVTWWAGFGPDPADVPVKIRHAILMLVGQYYERRLATEGQNSFEVPYGVQALLDASKWGAYS